MRSSSGLGSAKCPQRSSSRCPEAAAPPTSSASHHHGAWHAQEAIQADRLLGRPARDVSVLLVAGCAGLVAADRLAAASAEASEVEPLVERVEEPDALDQAAA